MISDICDRFWGCMDVYLRFIGRCDLSRQEWIYVGFGILLLGFVCMRGFGSRSKY
jgi:hypothetical protein